MPSPVAQYLATIQEKLSTGHAQEHSYRPALEALFAAVTKLRLVNEPKSSEHGRPDFIFVKNNIPVAWAEAKDLHVSLEKIEQGEQMARYFGYPNLILTNGLEFRFYKNGQKYGDGIILATKKGNAIETKEDAFSNFERTLVAFIADPVDTIRSAQHLAKIMGGKAQRLRDNIIEILNPQYGNTKGDIGTIFDVIKTKLIHDLTQDQFADLYAQTLVYGLFVARYHDDTETTFSRSEAREKIPASNHLLQQFFDHIAGANFEKKLSFIVDELCDVFVHADVHALVHGLYQKKDDTHDPIIHFYEDFLREYDPKLRMDRGVFYTPLPVVRYIVRSVDALLQEHFGLKQGLADREQIAWSFTEQGKTSKRMIDRVQVLDPAVGTGTFLNEVIRNVHERFVGQEGSWPQYVDEHLIPRLYGFELMMASYTIAHLKLSMTLAETGAKDFKKRIRVFLTNSLEEAPPQDDSFFKLMIGFQGALTEEAELAAEVKRDLPIMVVLGNPPYSVSSQNSSIEKGTDGKKRKTWIGALLDDYKKDLNEKKLNLDDDYIKFIRFAHHLVEKNGQGVVAMITNNSFLDGITHRRMRQSLLETFDHIYVLDLHGNSKRKEKAPDGGKDENVFDIQQGVSISLFVKTASGKKKGLGQVHHCDLYGKREDKYNYLDNNTFDSTDWQTLEAPTPNYFFVPKDFGVQEEYDSGLKLSELFPIWNSGVKTDRDSLFIDFDRDQLEKRMQKLLSGQYDQQFKTEFRVEDSGSYKITKILPNLYFDEKYLKPVLYRTFDKRTIYYDPKIISRPAEVVMSHMSTNKNLALCMLRLDRQQQFAFFVSNSLVGKDAVSSLDMCSVMPLYLYPTSSTLDNQTRTANLNMELLKPVLDRLGLTWQPEERVNRGFKPPVNAGECGPEDIFDYIYAMLHCPTYRERYKEFLKIDFPRVPFTSNKELFWKLVEYGHTLRALHLLEHPVLDKLITTYPVAGDNVVEKISYDPQSKRVFINLTQYFEGVDEDVWNFPIGGYQPLQKWLKDRKGRMLSSDDILHWQRVVVALKETGKVMGEIEALIGENGGFPLE